MRKMLIIALILLMVPFASAKLLADDVHISRIRIGDYGYVRGNERET